MSSNHMTIKQLSYGKPVKKWLGERYGVSEARKIWQQTKRNYRAFDMRLIDMVFRKSGDRDRKQITAWPAGFINISEPYDKEHHAARYCFTQCPNAEFAKSHGLLHVLPLMCNSDFFGIGEIHGRLIRCSTCGNGDVCDYLVVGNENPVAKEYETVMDEGGFLVSRKINGSPDAAGSFEGKQ